LKPITFLAEEVKRQLKVGTGDIARWGLGVVGVKPKPMGQILETGSPSYLPMFEFKPGQNPFVDAFRNLLYYSNVYIGKPIARLAGAEDKIHWPEKPEDIKAYSTWNPDEDWLRNLARQTTILGASSIAVFENLLEWEAIMKGLGWTWSKVSPYAKEFAGFVVEKTKPVWSPIAERVSPITDSIVTKISQLLTREKYYVPEEAEVVISEGGEGERAISYRLTGQKDVTELVKQGKIPLEGQEGYLKLKPEISEKVGGEEFDLSTIGGEVKVPYSPKPRGYVTGELPTTPFEKPPESGPMLWRLSKWDVFRSEKVLSPWEVKGIKVAGEPSELLAWQATEKGGLGAGRVGVEGYIAELGREGGEVAYRLGESTPEVPGKTFFGRFKIVYPWEEQAGEESFLDLRGLFGSGRKWWSSEWRPGDFVDLRGIDFEITPTKEALEREVSIAKDFVKDLAKEVKGESTAVGREASSLGTGVEAVSGGGKPPESPSGGGLLSKLQIKPSEVVSNEEPIDLGPAIPTPIKIREPIIKVSFSLGDVGKTLEQFAPEIGRGLTIGGSQLLKVSGEEILGESMNTRARTRQAPLIEIEIDNLLRQINTNTRGFEIPALPGVELSQKGKSKETQSPMGREFIGFKPFIEEWEREEERSRIAPIPRNREFTFLDERQTQKQLQKLAQELSLSQSTITITRQSQRSSSQGESGGGLGKGNTPIETPKLPSTPTGLVSERHLYGRKLWRVSWFGALDESKILGVSTKSKSTLIAIKKSKKTDNIFDIDLLGEKKTTRRKGKDKKSKKSR